MSRSSLVNASRSTRGSKLMPGAIETIQDLLQIVLQAQDFTRPEAEMLALLLGNPLVDRQVELLRFLFVYDTEILSERDAPVAVD